MIDSQLKKEPTSKTDVGFWSALQLRYSYPRLRWIVLTIASVSALYISSEEIWTVADGKPFPEFSTESMLLYAAFFLPILFAVHYRDAREAISQRQTAVALSVASMAIDISILGVSELLVLLSVQVLPQEGLSVMKLLLLGAFPGALGVVTLSSLTVDILKERASRLKREVQDIDALTKSLEKKMKDTEAAHEVFKNRMREFEERYSNKTPKEDATA